MWPVGPAPSSPQGPGLGLRGSAPDSAVVAHGTAVPISPRAHLSGHGRFMRYRGFQVHAITSPGPEADEFSRRALRARHGAAAPERVLSDFRREALWEAIALEYRTRLAERGALPLGGDGLRPAPAATPSTDRELA